jgi:ribosomal protein S18 acetylase RimI-like enzyme
MPPESDGLPVIRPLRWPDDSVALAALDTSTVTDHVLRCEFGESGVALRAETLDQPLSKRFPLDGGRRDLDLDLAVVAEAGGEVVGYAAARLHKWNRRAELRHLYVAPGRRRSGLGARLLEEAVRWARSQGARGLWLETQNVNPGAVAFYRLHGFRLCGLDDSLYDPRGPAGGEVALYFYLPLHEVPASAGEIREDRR